MMIPTRKQKQARPRARAVSKRKWDALQMLRRIGEIAPNTDLRQVK